MEGLIFGILRYFVLATYFHIALRNEVAPFNTILIGTNDDSNIARENWTHRGDYLFLPSNKSQIMEKRNSNNKTIACRSHGNLGSFEFELFKINSLLIVFAGYGNIVPRTTNGRLFCIFYAFFGIPLTCLTLKTIGEKLRDLMTSLIHSVKRRLGSTQRVRNGIVCTINIFLWIITLLFLSLLAHWRRGWTIFEGFYFCFITFSTIGFGDFVAFDDNEANTFTDYMVVIVGVVLGFAAMSTVLFSCSSMMENKSKETSQLAQKFHDVKKRLKLRGTAVVKPLKHRHQNETGKSEMTNRRDQ